MPTYQLAAADDLGWLETIDRLSSREACYRAALASGEGSYVVMVGDDRDRELRVSADGQLTYRIPGASGWHTWQGKA